MSTIQLARIVVVFTLLGCPDQPTPSNLPKPDDPATDEPGIDTVPPSPPRPQAAENPQTPPLHHKDGK